MIIFLISAGCIFGGAVLGLVLSGLLPEGHLRDNSRDTVKVVTGMIATLAAHIRSPGNWLACFTQAANWASSSGSSSWM